MSQEATKPAIILVPGAFHKATHFYKLAMHLTMAGYTASILDLPTTTSDFGDSSSSSASQPLPTYEDDVSTIANAIREFTNVGRNVALVMHGYAGNPGSQACCGLGRQSIQSSGETEGAVVKLIYLSAWLPLENQDFHSLLPQSADDGDDDDDDDDDDATTLEPFYLPLENDTRFIHAKNPRELLYHDISDSGTIGSALLSLQPKIAAHTFLGPEKCAWREEGISTSYILCEDDRVMAPAMAERMIQLVEAEGVRVSTTRLKSGHSPMLSRPGQTSRAIVKMIEE